MKKFKYLSVPDGIIPAMLQNALTAIAPILGYIFKTCLRLSHIRVLGRKVTYMRKAVRTTLSKDYRPISLSIFLLKGLLMLKSELYSLR